MPIAIVQHGAPNIIAGVFRDVKGGEETAKSNAALIVKAVNEYDALNAVAVAAQQLVRATRATRLDAVVNVSRTLKALATLRAKEVA